MSVKTRAPLLMGAILLLASLLVMRTAPVQAVTIFEGAGLVNVTAAVTDFRAVLGNPNNGNAPGPLTDGRREINWDARIVPFEMPGDFFNTTVPRGAVFTTPGSGFRVSNDGSDNEFNTFNAAYPDEFATFSPQRLFSPLDSTITDVRFFVPGSNTPAFVQGFGAIFTDVDLADVSRLEFFDLRGNTLLSRTVLPDAQGLSFLGVFFDGGERIGRVRMTSGNTHLGGLDGLATDVVVLDDLLYSEPQAVSEPGSLSLMGSGVIGLLGYGWRRRKFPPV